ncbi:uncharacterized protein LOC128148692 isoform X1 [Harpia harpyja]|uniref:uncharacterized protein LOC128148692 isoform X1 n=1 Tax=Harpia harpyja TaxID=202280 RepID=UPI0022B0DC7A|nr:uncharacterized protein LOC128148692 isoform X1 [Harpia harpyja]
MFPVMEKMNKPIPHHLSFLRPVCCFLVGVFFIVCIIRKPTHEERKKEVNGKQTSGMAINSSGERTACLLQASRPAAEYARSPCACYEIFHSKHKYKINAVGVDVDLHQEIKAGVKGRKYVLTLWLEQTTTLGTASRKQSLGLTGARLSSPGGHGRPMAADTGEVRGSPVAFWRSSKDNGVDGPMFPRARACGGGVHRGKRICAQLGSSAQWKVELSSQRVQHTRLGSSRVTCSSQSVPLCRCTEV